MTTLQPKRAGFAAKTGLKGLKPALAQSEQRRVDKTGRKELKPAAKQAAVVADHQIEMAYTRDTKNGHATFGTVDDVGKPLGLTGHNFSGSLYLSKDFIKGLGFTPRSLTVTITLNK